MPLLQVLVGILYETKGDSIISQKYYTKAAACFDMLLDTIDIHNNEYSMLSGMKALNLVLLGQREKGINYISKICEQQKKEDCKEIITDFASMTRKKLLNEILDTK